MQSRKRLYVQKITTVVIGRNAKIIPKVWNILMYLLFKNFSLVIFNENIISKNQNNIEISIPKKLIRIIGIIKNIEPIIITLRTSCIFSITIWYK